MRRYVFQLQLTCRLRLSGWQGLITNVQFDEELWVSVALTPMQRCVRGQGSRRCRRGPERARTVLEFCPDVLLAEIEELGQCLLRVCVRDTFNKLVDSTDSVQPHVGACVVEDHVEDHIIEAIRKVNAYLAASAGDGVDHLH